jgi:hypothetical protein
VSKAYLSLAIFGALGIGVISGAIFGWASVPSPKAPDYVIGVTQKDGQTYLGLAPGFKDLAECLRIGTLAAKAHPDYQLSCGSLTLTPIK